jgi:Calcineurin-like phosphoesterase
MSFQNNFLLLFMVVFLSFGLSTVGIFVTLTFGAVETNQSDFNFVAAGDFGCGGNANRTITNMLAKEPELVIGLGDLSYQKTADCWFDVVSPLDTDGRLKIAIGDNEMFPAKYSEYMKHFKMDSPFYSFDYGNVHFLSMATAKNKAIPYNETSKQYEFVKEDLKRAHENKSINWIIVYSFRTFYSSNTTHPGLDELQDLYHPLFEKNGVDIVLQAHNHNYQRTYPLMYNQTKTFTPIITDKNTEKYTGDQKGPIFITVGTGGEDLYNFTGQAPYVITQFQRHGFLNVDIVENGTKLNGIFYENRERSNKDEFTIIK